VNIRSQR